jgi:pilus assembly protein CpaB
VNPRQRRGVLLLVLAGLGTIAVFVAVSNYVADVRSRVGPEITVLKLTSDLQPYQPVNPTVVRAVLVPQRWAPNSAMHDINEVAGKVAGAFLARGSYLEVGMVVPPPQIEPGQRELAIMVDSETGVAGKIAPGSVVDILATFPADDQSKVPPKAEIIVAGARIIEVGTPTTVQKEVAGGFSQNKVVPVTFALSIKDTLVLTYAESFATRVRLALVGGGDTTTVPLDQRILQIPAGQP